MPHRSRPARALVAAPRLALALLCVPRLAIALVAALVAQGGASRTADAEPAPRARWLCAPPRRGPLNECWKGNSLDDGDVERCLARQRARRPRPARLRLDDGPWIEFPTRGWRCVALPADHRPMIAIENYGRTYAAWRQRPTTCPSGVLDLVGPNFYGAMYAQCSKRRHLDRDERVAPP